jgi:DNA-binding NarL/FixJ family response regulator/tetratricopeptide (TPR) repeat protein
MSTAADDLVGRGPELAALDRVLDAVAAGGPGFLAVVGEPGIGKTSVMERLSELAAGRGWLVLAGRAAEFERELPFGVLVDALDDHLATLDRRRLERAGGERLAELATIFPAIDGPAVPEGALQVERYRAHRAVQELLDGLAVGRPLLLALDDLHWADEASLEVVASLLRRPPDGPVLLACAFRPAPAPPFLESAIAAAERERRAERIDLGPLTPEAAAELLAPIPEPSVRDAVFRVSGGNPFYLSQLARFAIRHPVPRGDVRLLDTLTLGVPQSVMSMLAEEVRSLPPGSRRVLEAAAVAGEPFEPDVAAEIGEVSEAEVGGALDDLLARDLVRATDVPRHFRFRHPLVRRAVYAHAGGGWRLAAHGRAAAALASRGASAAAQAHHVEHSARRGDERAIALLSRAAATAAPRAPATAARWLQAAVRLVPEAESHPGIARRVELLRGLADAQRACGRLDACRSTLLQALELAPAEDAVARVRLVTACAAVEHWLGRHSEASARLDAALAELGDVRSAGAVALRVERAVEHLHSMDFGAALAVAGEAHAVACELGDVRATGASGSIVCLTAVAAGDVASARASAGEAAARLDGVRDADLADDLSALWYLGWAEVLLERFDAGLAHLRRGVAVSRATGRGDLIVPMLLGQARALLTLGHAQEAAEVGDEAIEIARGSGNPQYVVWALWERGRTHLLADRDAAQVLAEEALALARDLSPALLAPAEPAWTLASALIEGGEHERGRALLLDAIGGADAPRVAPPERAAAYEELAYVALRRGAPAEAAEWAARAVQLADELGLGVPAAQAYRADAAARLAAGDAAGALASARTAVAAATAAGARRDAAQAQLLAGRALAAQGESEAATRELAEAEAALDATGARRRREEAAQELRRLGHRVARRPRPAGVPAGAGLEQLTEREREIAELVRDRRTNREIAGELFLSEKTVETHLRNIFVKLGVGSRVEVARAVERGGG